MNPTILGIELKRIFRDPVTLFFTAVLPAFMYLIFGVTMAFGDYDIGNGNYKLYIMIAMAAYGAVTATVGVGGMAAVERMQGWGRQLGLTPLRDEQYVATKSVTALVIAAIPILLTNGLGLVTGARGSTTAWLGSLAIVLAGAALFALYGLCFGLAFRSETAVSAAGGSLVILGFLGNVFMPLSGWMLTVAKFTPLYGYVTLARWPLTDGDTVDMNSGALVPQELWQPLANVGAWTLILAALAVILVRRGRGRQ